MSPQNAKLAKLPTIRRFPLYLHVLYGLQQQEREVVSSAHLARDLEIDQVLVKKDLEITGITGKTGVGFVTDDLVDAIERYLGWNNTTEAFLIGTGDLGSALLGYEGFMRHGLKIVAAFDIDKRKIGSEIHGVQVFPMTKLEHLLQRMRIQLVVLTVPADVAQEVTDLLVQYGVGGIWNFTPTKLQVPDEVVVQREDLAAGLAELSVKLNQRRPKRKAAKA